MIAAGPRLVFLVLAALLFALAAARRPQPPEPEATLNLLGAGLTLFALAWVFAG